MFTRSRWSGSMHSFSTCTPTHFFFHLWLYIFLHILMKWIPLYASFKRAAFSLVCGVLLRVYDKKRNRLNEATALMSKDNVTRLLKIFCHAHFCSHFKEVHYILLIKPRIIERGFKRWISGTHWNMDCASVASFLNIQPWKTPSRLSPLH